MEALCDIHTHEPPHSLSHSNTHPRNPSPPPTHPHTQTYHAVDAEEEGSDTKPLSHTDDMLGEEPDPAIEAIHGTEPILTTIHIHNLKGNRREGRRSVVEEGSGYIIKMNQQSSNDQ